MSDSEIKVEQTSQEGIPKKYLVVALVITISTTVMVYFESLLFVAIFVPDLVIHTIAIFTEGTIYKHIPYSWFWLVYSFPLVSIVLYVIAVQTTKFFTTITSNFSMATFTMIYKRLTDNSTEGWKKYIQIWGYFFLIILVVFAQLLEYFISSDKLKYTPALMIIFFIPIFVFFGRIVCMSFRFMFFWRKQDFMQQSKTWNFNWLAIPTQLIDPGDLMQAESFRIIFNEMRLDKKEIFLDLFLD